MIGIIAAIVALVLLHKSASMQAPTTHVSVGVPTGLGVAPVPQRGGLVRDPILTQTWQNWQTTKGTPVPAGSAQDVLAPATAMSDTKINQITQLESGLTVTNPPTVSGSGGGGSFAPSGTASGASGAGAGTGHLPGGRFGGGGGSLIP